MVRLSSEQGCFFKLYHFALTLWSVVMLFIVSLCKKNPRDARKEDATPFRSSANRPSGGGGGGDGGGVGGFGGDGIPGRNIRGLQKNRGVTSLPMGGGG